VSAPDLSGREAEYVLDAVRSSWISSTGPYVDRFEREFASIVGTRTTISVANGTVALHLAMLGHAVGPGDEVIVPSLTYIATANAVRYVGAEPVFVDVDPANWCLDPDKIEAAITPRTRGIIAVHLYGHPADMDRINGIAKRKGLWVVEDAAEAHGASYKGRPAGSLSSMATFSFYGNKILTSGEGGAVTLNDEALERRVRLLRGQGMDPARRYHFVEIGYNYRLTNVACAILCGQIEHMEQIVLRRREIFATYRAELESTPGIDVQPSAAWAEPAPWLFCITVDAEAFGRDRDELALLLAAAGVETRPLFPALHRQPPYVQQSVSRPGLPITDALSATGLSLPTYPALKAADISRVVGVIRAAKR
jgi:perosamine synthetase